MPFYWAEKLDLRLNGHSVTWHTIKCCFYKPETESNDDKIAKIKQNYLDGQYKHIMVVTLELWFKLNLLNWIKMTQQNSNHPLE